MSLKRLLCLIGIHDWLYTSPHHDADRYCRRCPKHEQAVYDMAYGSTYYVEYSESSL